MEHTQNAEFYGLVIGPKAEKKDTIKFGRPICNPKMLKVGPEFFWLRLLSVKRALDETVLGGCQASCGGGSVPSWNSLRSRNVAQSHTLDSQEI